MTTDRYPKVRRAEVAGELAGETVGGSVVGIAKGGGMIEPNMATMYVHI
jgi:glutamate N-acetyltransferase/amino-acid N-acetyltransferase